MLSVTPEQRLPLIYRLAGSFGSGGEEPPDLLQEGLLKSNWQRQIDAAEKYLPARTFTTFVAYEWSSLPNGANLHRNVIFRGPKYPQLPFSSLDSANPEDLWRYIEHQRSLGIQALAIPHNCECERRPDVVVCRLESQPDQPRVRRDARQYRAPGRNHAAEGHERDASGAVSRTTSSPSFELIENLLTVARPSSIHGSYVRQAYARGLEIEQRTGVNPFQFGLIGSTDYHSGLSRSTENDFAGNFGPAPDVKKLLEDTTSLRGVKVSSGGLAGVWAESNTRDSIFDALYRRETFATSGTRPRVRFFSGLQVPGRHHQAARLGEARLCRRRADGLPICLRRQQRAARKRRASWCRQSRIRTAPISTASRSSRCGSRTASRRNRSSMSRGPAIANPTPSGKLPAVGSTVNVETATYTNDIGVGRTADRMAGPDVRRADQAAVYYARVLEIPTPRWTTHLAAAEQIAASHEVPPTIQERAWTSPVFYRP